MLKIILLVSIISIQAWALNRPDGSRSGNGESTKMSPSQKQEKKLADRWTMSDWFDTKKAISDQNRWLSLNRSPVKYEFYIGGEQTTYELSQTASGTTTKTNYALNRGSAAAYTSIFGVQAGYFDSAAHAFGWDASVNIRIYGNSIQHTNLTLIYGAKTRIDNSQAATETFRFQYYGGSFALYLFKQFGIEGLYQQVVDDKSDLGTAITGNNIEGTVFIDYGIVRLQGIWFKEALSYLYSSSVRTDKTSQGILGGIRIYF